MTEYSATELMVSRASKELENGDSTLVGIGIPNLACNLAKRTHAPELEMVYESGTIDSDPTKLPLSIGDPVLATNAKSVVPMLRGFEYFLQPGRIDVGFLGGAQVDRFGNINSTVIGNYEDPDVRLPGSGGACEIASHAGRTIIISPHERRRFPKQVDFITSPGYLDGQTTRAEIGLRGGPDVVITDKAVMRFDENGEMYVTSLHPRATKDDVQESTGWEIRFDADLDTTEPPTETELDLIRNELDPDRAYTG